MWDVRIFCALPQEPICFDVRPDGWRGVRPPTFTILEKIINIVVIFRLASNTSGKAGAKGTSDESCVDCP